MNTKTLGRRRLPVTGRGGRRTPAPSRPGVERLEQRLMLAGDLQAGITVGRTLSSWTTTGVQGDRLQITYSVYNERSDEVSGVLLATTLQPGVSFVTASQSPDRSGQEPAWSLGTIAPFGVASVEVTVALPATVPLQIDAGARAFGTVSADAVADTAPPATLRAGTVPAGLLASTPDANTTDPFVRREAAELDYDPQRIIAFLRDRIGYESYSGSLRGARGTLWSAAGNALDEASLGVALMRASEVPARYAHGLPPDAPARELILSMFAPPSGAIGMVPPGAAVADPAADPKLLAEARDHYWIQFDAGGGFQDIDTAFADAQIGQTFAPASSTFAEVDDGLRHKTTVRLDAEITNTPPPPCSGFPASRRRRCWRRRSTTWTSSGDC